METTATSTKPLSEARVETIMWDIVDSLIANRNPTPAERAEVTNKIARRRRVTVQQVAGVRAALTSERYGSLTSLIRRRRKALASS